MQLLDWRSQVALKMGEQPDFGYSVKLQVGIVKDGGATVLVDVWRLETLTETAAGTAVVEIEASDDNCRRLRMLVEVTVVGTFKG